jgi:acyl carrier protein
MTRLLIADDSGELRTWMIEYIAEVLKIDDAALATSATFDSLGLDSVEAVVMTGVMEEHFGVDIDPALLFESPSIDAFVAAHAGKHDAVQRAG